MKCPVCKDVDLVMSDRQGVEIDYCPNCRGVWLDRGELDKIVERSLVQQSPSGNNYSQPNPYAQQQQQQQRYEKHQKEYDRYSNQDGYKKKKKESFLSELFDFEF